MSPITKQINNGEFVRLACLKHANLYTYVNFLYVNKKTKGFITCPEHGDFLQNPKSHLKGRGCPRCKHKLRGHTKDNYLKRIKEQHGETYSAYVFKEVSSRSFVSYTCPSHGRVTQRLDAHLKGHGCKQCGIDSTRHNKSKQDAETRERLLVLCKSMPVELCLTTREYMEIFDVGTRAGMTGLLNKHDIPFEVNYTNGEKEILSFVREATDRNVILNDRQLIAPYELDILIPHRKIAFEFNGAYWHSVKNKTEKNYHSMKSELCRQKGYQLVHIFENDLLLKPEIVSSIVKMKLGKVDETFYGRKLTVVSLSSKESQEFLSTNHLYNSRLTGVNYGLVEDEEIVAVMTFGPSTFNSSYQWELVRYAPRLNTAVVGGAAKLWKHFILEHSPINTVCYADSRLFDGKLYEKLGFVNEGITSPNIWYYKEDLVLRHRMNFTKPKLKKAGYMVNENETAQQNTLDAGYNAFHDCGSHRLTWRR